MKKHSNLGQIYTRLASSIDVGIFLVNLQTSVDSCILGATTGDDAKKALR